MIKRPRFLDLVAAFLLVIAASLPLQIMFLYGHPLSEYEEIMAKLTPLNWGILTLAPLCAWLVFRASPLCIPAIPLLGALVAYNNWFVGKVGTDYSLVSTTIGTLFFFAVVGSLVRAETRQLFLNPRKRWWLTPVRHIAQIPIRLQVEGKSEFYTTTFDVSDRGAFIPFSGERGKLYDFKSRKVPLPVPTSLQKYKVGSQCYVCLNLKELLFIQCRAEIVRVAEPNGKYPGGVGIRFLGLGWEDRRVLNSYLRGAAAQREPLKPQAPTAPSNPGSQAA